jgi:hypothetical protein
MAQRRPPRYALEGGEQASIARRSAIAEEDNTVVLVIGAEPGAAFEITPAEREELTDAGLSVHPA